MVRLALEGVVVHGENLLVVVLARDGVGNLEEVHELVDEHEQALVAGTGEELGEKLEVVVPVVIRDDDVDAQLGLGLGLGAEFAAQPAQRRALALLVLV